MKNPEFQINQLRLDKIIYAVEAVAINITCFSVTILVGNFLGEKSFDAGYNLITPAILSIGIIFTLYALIGNLLRLRKIRQLEKSI
ncbi:MAG: hypothetical protein WAV41_06020 [Microgenomates group bacterium]